jgi:YHS domain-containing protein
MRIAAWAAGPALVMALIAAGCGGREPSTAPAPKTGGEVIAQKICPVMGNPIDPKIFADHKGRRIYFCCEMCPPRFKEDPEKYIKIVDEELKAAKGGAPERK